MAIRIIQTGDPLADPAVLAVRDLLRAGGLTGVGQGQVDIPAAVRQIIDDVAARGDAAVVDWTQRLHQVRSDELFVPAERLARAHSQADKAFLRLVRRVVKNIRAYQKRILVKAPRPLVRGGRRLGVRYVPLSRVAVYVPGGRALYPSTVLMTVVPAQVAGVGEVVMVTPPGPDGQVSDMVLALAAELGVGRVLVAAGVAALAACAIGTASVPQVDKIVGPGSAFIAEAKRQLLGRVGIDSVAGPSEVLIIADSSADPAWVAADMLAQAEHDPGSAVLVTDSADLARRVSDELERQIPLLERAQATRQDIEKYSAIIVVPDLAKAAQVANSFATEHLQITTRDDDAVLAATRNAGAIFVGRYTPVPLGDYYAGPSHVLPTGGTARFFSPLSANDFVKSSSVIRYDAAALAEDAADVADFAGREGLTAHAKAVEIRQTKNGQRT